jgi:rod shape-determining protein MreC
VHTSKRSVFTILAVVLLLIILVSNSRSITNPGRARILDTASFPLRTIHNISSSLSGIVPFAGLRQENRRLKGEVDLLKRKIEELRPVSDENARLKDVLAFKRSQSFSTIPAEVIGRDLSNWSNSVIIGKGMLNGIRANAAVMSTKGLVGRVLEVGRYSSRILLITDPNSKVGVVIQRNRQGGMLVGRPDGKCKMIYISLNSDVTKGDKVVTAGLSTVFPPGILVGEVVGTGKEPGRLYKYAVIDTSQDMSGLEEVLCAK